MATEIARGRRADPVIQFSVFTPNRLGRLHDLIALLAAKSVHVLGLTILDTTDSSIIRLVVDDPDGARELLLREGFPYTESKLVVVEAEPTELNRLMAALLEAELISTTCTRLSPIPRVSRSLALVSRTMRWQ